LPVAAETQQRRAHACAAIDRASIHAMAPRYIRSILAIQLNNDPTGGSAEDSPEQRSNGIPRDDRNDDVRHKDEGDQNAQFHRARLADR
jgi:hypothetical protein